MEIGAGLGIMAHFSKKYKPNSKFIILDIPHTLLIQYHFLKTMGYNVILLEESQLENINNIIINSEFDILLILPHHISYIKDGIVDLMLNFDSLVELNTDTIKHYLDNIVRISKYFYNVNKKYGNYNYLMNKINDLNINNKLTILEKKPQIYGTGSEYWFHIALSEDYISLLTKIIR